MANSHAVLFYDDDDSLARHVAEFILEGFAEGAPAVVVARSLHRARILMELRGKGVDVIRVQIDGDLILLDAETLLADFIIEGFPDVPRFRRLATALLDKIYKGRTDRVARLYGEMVDVLWKAGQQKASARLETLWNQIGETYPFALMCSYSTREPFSAAAMQEICAHHTHVLHEPGESPIVH
jgi:MEDS: MEthanogen/methylotroph, DcmR Sensory domain